MPNHFGVTKGEEYINLRLCIAKILKPLSQWRSRITKEADTLCTGAEQVPAWG
jgi:hypothetical protein